MKKNETYRTEFHVHTRTSKDSILFYWLLLIMLKIKKINTVVITDHNEISGAINIKNKFLKHNIEVIVGEEIFTSNGEIIGINLTSKIKKNLTPEETIKQIKKQGGLVYIPHPFDEKRIKTVLEEKYISKLKKDIDFIEVHNGRNISKVYDKKQNEIAEKYKLRKIIGSDAHTFFEIGRNYIVTSEKVTSKNVLECCENAIFHERNCIKIAHYCTKIDKLIRMISRGELNGIIRIINRKFKKGK